MKTRGLAYRVPVWDIGDDGCTLHIVADKAACADAAEDLGVDAVESLSADLMLTADSDGTVEVRGDVAADLRQTCVISLEPIARPVSANVDVTLVPADEGDAETRSIFADLDAPESYTDRKIGVREIILDVLAEALDSYPRLPGTAFSDHIEDRPEDAEGPFAVLAKLREDGGH